MWIRDEIKIFKRKKSPLDYDKFHFQNVCFEYMSMLVGLYVQTAVTIDIRYTFSCGHYKI